MLKKGYYKEVGGDYIEVNSVLPNGKYEVTMGTVIEGYLEPWDGDEKTEVEIQKWIEEREELLRKHWEEFPIDDLGRPLVKKICVGCQGEFLLPQEYDVCDSCADRREHGFDF